jgi:hypothetical protein
MSELRRDAVWDRRRCKHMTHGRDGCCMAETSHQTSNLPIAGIASVAIALLIVRDGPFVAARPPAVASRRRAVGEE